MRVIGRLIGLLMSLMIGAMIAGAIGAGAVKRRIVPVDDPGSDEIRLASIFGPLAFRSTATSFRGGTVDCWYGGGSIDLRGATLDPAGATLRVRAVFGGGTVVVPGDWDVTVRISGIGGAGDGRPKTERAADAPHLTITGIVAFGGFGIVSELPEAAERQLFGEAAAAPDASIRTPGPAPEEVEPASAEPAVV